jgi:hypothetical protein
LQALEGRFVVGIGTSEALNEHVTTARQASIDVLTSLPLALPNGSEDPLLMAPGSSASAAAA